MRVTDDEGGQTLSPPIAIRVLPQSSGMEAPVALLEFHDETDDVVFRMDSDGNLIFKGGILDGLGALSSPSPLESVWSVKDSSDGLVLRLTLSDADNDWFFGSFDLSGQALANQSLLEAATDIVIWRDGSDDPVAILDESGNLLLKGGVFSFGVF